MGVVGRPAVSDGGLSFPLGAAPIFVGLLVFGAIKFLTNPLTQVVGQALGENWQQASPSDFFLIAVALLLMFAGYVVLPAMFGGAGSYLAVRALGRVTSKAPALRGTGVRGPSPVAPAQPQVFGRLRGSMMRSSSAFARVPHFADAYFDNFSKLAGERVRSSGPVDGEATLGILLAAFPSAEVESSGLMEDPDLQRARREFMYVLARQFGLSPAGLAEALAREVNQRYGH